MAVNSLPDLNLDYSVINLGDFVTLGFIWNGQGFYSPFHTIKAGMSKADYIALLPLDTRYQIVGMRGKAVPTALASIIRKDISQLLLDGFLSMENLWI